MICITLEKEFFNSEWHLGIESLSTTQSENPMSIDINKAHEKLGHVYEHQVKLTFLKVGVKVTRTLKACEGCLLEMAKQKANDKVTHLRSNTP